MRDRSFHYFVERTWKTYIPVFVAIIELDQMRIFVYVQILSSSKLLLLLGLPANEKKSADRERKCNHSIGYVDRLQLTQAPEL